MAKICPICNTRNSNNAEFCQGCGQELENIPSSGRSIPLMSIIIIIILIIGIGVPLYFMWSIMIGPSLNENYLEENGINGTAEILEAHQTQSYVNNNPEIKMTLLVSVPGKEPYKANYTTVVAMVDLPKVQPGNRWYVLVDPNDPQNVVFA